MDRKLDERAFFNACIRGDIEIVKVLLSKNTFHIDVKTEEGWTGLIIACFNNRKEVVKFLVREGADVNAVNKKGTTVFMYAKTPILETHDTEILEFLLKNNADINSCDCNGKSVLDYVLKNNAQWLANWLTKRGALSGSKLN